MVDATSDLLQPHLPTPLNPADPISPSTPLNPADPISQPLTQPSSANGSWKSKLFDPVYPSSDRDLVFLEPTVDGERKIASCRRSEIELIAKEWEGKLLGFLLGKKRPHLPSLKKTMISKWCLKCPLELSFRGNDAILLKFSSDEEKTSVLESGPWFFSGRLLVLKPWRRQLMFSDFDTSMVPIWVRLPNLPVEFWSKDSLSRIGSLLGRPLFSDKMTASRARSSFARICVEVSASMEFPTEISIDIEGTERFSQLVKADWMPARCSTCKEFFHNSSSCPIQKKSVSSNLQSGSNNPSFSTNLVDQSRSKAQFLPNTQRNLLANNLEKFTFKKKGKAKMTTWIPTEQVDSQKLSRVDSSNGWKTVPHKKNRIFSLGSNSMPGTENRFSPLDSVGKGVCGSSFAGIPNLGGSSFAGIPNSGGSSTATLPAGQGVCSDVSVGQVVEPVHANSGIRTVKTVADPTFAAPVECASEVSSGLVGLLPPNSEKEPANVPGGAGQDVGIVSDFEPISEGARQGYVPGDLSEEQSLADSLVQKQLLPEESGKGDLFVGNAGPVVDMLASSSESTNPVLCQALECPPLPQVTCSISGCVDIISRNAELVDINGGLVALEPNPSGYEDPAGNGMKSVDLPVKNLDEIPPLLNSASVCSEQTHETLLATSSTRGSSSLNQHPHNSIFLETHESNIPISSILSPPTSCPTHLLPNPPNSTLNTPNPPLAQPNPGPSQIKPILDQPSPSSPPNIIPSQPVSQQPVNPITHLALPETEQDSPFPPGFSPNSKEMAELRNLLINCASGIPDEHRKDYEECMKHVDDAEILEFYRDRFGTSSSLRHKEGDTSDKNLQKDKLAVRERAKEDTNYVTFHDLRRSPRLRKKPAKLADSNSPSGLKKGFIK